MKSLLIVLSLLTAVPALSNETFEGVAADQMEISIEEAFLAAHNEDSIREGEEHPKKVIVCASQNARGFIFKSKGYIPRKVQARAQAKCEYYSSVCRPLGCR